MEKITIEQLLEIAKDIDSKGIKWHHHYLPPECLLSEKRPNKHVIILENHETGEVWYSEDDEKRMEELEKLENMFFKRT